MLRRCLKLRNCLQHVKKPSIITHRPLLFRISKNHNSTLQSSLQMGLNDNQLAIQELALNFMETKLKPNALKWDETHTCPYDVIKEAAQLGFGGIYVGEEYGGTGLSRHDTTLVFEALSQGCVSTTAIITIHNMTAWMLDKFGDDSLKQQYLNKMIKCEMMGSYCLTEPHSGSDAAALSTTAKRDGNDYIINGSKVFVSGGGGSDVYFVMTRTGPKPTTEKEKSKNITCVIVPGTAKGVVYGKNEQKMGWNASPTRQVTFDNVRVPITNRVGQEGQGFKIALMGLDGGRLNIAACSLGGAHRCLQQAMNYIEERQQFGQKISKFQYNQFKIVDMATDLHSSRLMLRNAANCLDENHPQKTMYCAMAKKHVTDLCYDICNGALQMFGGYGYLKEYEVERFVRDLRVHKILEGTNEVMRLIVARNLLPDAFRE